MRSPQKRLRRSPRSKLDRAIAANLQAEEGGWMNISFVGKTALFVTAIGMTTCSQQLTPPDASVPVGVILSYTRDSTLPPIPANMVLTVTGTSCCSGHNERLAPFACPLKSVSNNQYICERSWTVYAVNHACDNEITLRIDVASSSAFPFDQTGHGLLINGHPATRFVTHFQTEWAAFSVSPDGAVY
jgi:hypothetical protein